MSTNRVEYALSGALQNGWFSIHSSNEAPNSIWKQEISHHTKYNLRKVIKNSHIMYIYKDFKDI